MDKKLSGLYRKFIDDFLKKNDNPLCKECIVKDSIPIVHFGNLDNYQNVKVNLKMYIFANLNMTINFPPLLN